MPWKYITLLVSNEDTFIEYIFVPLIISLISTTLLVLNELKSSVPKLDEFLNILPIFSVLLVSIDVKSILDKFLNP